MVTGWRRATDLFMLHQVLQRFLIPPSRTVLETKLDREDGECLLGTQEVRSKKGANGQRGRLLGGRGRPLGGRRDRGEWEELPRNMADSRSNLNVASSS